MIFLSCTKNIKNFLIYLSQVLVLGQPGEEVSLELILRVVADVGLVVSILPYIASFFKFANKTQFRL